MTENVIGFTPGPGRRSPVSQKAGRFTESVIREMTRLAFEHNAVNLAQGFPNFPAPEEVKEAAVNAIRADINQYEITWGAPEFRRAVAERFRRDTGLEVDPEREMTVCCGATETMIASLLAIIDPGDEVVVFEPFYENYGPDAIICGAATRHVRLHPPDWTFDPAELAAAFTDRTRAVILNTPNNPTGKVFTATNSNWSPSSAAEPTPMPLPTRFINFSFMTASSTSRWRLFPACASAPSPSTPCQKPTASRGGAWVTPLRPRWSRTPFARCTTSLPWGPRRPCSKPAPPPCAFPKPITRSFARVTGRGATAC